MTISNISISGNRSTSMPSNTCQSPDWYENLWQASREGNLDEIKSIIEQSYTTLTSSPGEFALCFIVAAREGHKDIIEFFISLNMLKAISQKTLGLCFRSRRCIGKQS